MARSGQPPPICFLCDHRGYTVNLEPHPWLNVCASHSRAEMSLFFRHVEEHDRRDPRTVDGEATSSSDPSYVPLSATGPGIARCGLCVAKTLPPGVFANICESHTHDEIDDFLPTIVGYRPAQQRTGEATSSFHPPDMPPPPPDDEGECGVCWMKSGQIPRMVGRICENHTADDICEAFPAVVGHYGFRPPRQTTTGVASGSEDMVPTSDLAKVRASSSKLQPSSSQREGPTEASNGGIADAQQRVADLYDHELTFEAATALFRVWVADTELRSAKAKLEEIGVDDLPAAALRQALSKVRGTLREVERLSRTADERGRADSVATPQQGNVNGKGKGRAMDDEVVESRRTRFKDREEHEQEDREQPGLDEENVEEAETDIDVPQLGGQKKKLKSRKKRSKAKREETKLNRELFGDD